MSGCGRGRQQRVNDQDESERPVLTAGSRAAGTIFHDHREARLVRRTRDDECGGVLTVKGASDHSLQQSIGGEIVVAGCAQNTAAVSQEAVAAAQKRESRSVRAHDAAQRITHEEGNSDEITGGELSEEAGARPNPGIAQAQRRTPILLWREVDRIETIGAGGAQAQSTSSAFTLGRGQAAPSPRGETTLGNLPRSVAFEACFECRPYIFRVITRGFGGRSARRRRRPHSVR